MAFYDDESYTGRPKRSYIPAANRQMVQYSLPSGGIVTLPSTARQPRNTGRITLSPQEQATEIASARKRGFGEVSSPSVIPGAGGNYLSRGGVMTPVENLTGRDRAVFAPSPFEFLRSRGTFGSAIANLGTFGQSIYRLLNRNMSGAPAEYGRRQGLPPDYFAAQ